WITNSSPNYHGLYDKTTTPSFNVQLGVDATNTSLFRVSWKPSTTYTFKVITQMGRLFSESIVSPATPSSLPILYAQEETMLLNNVPYYTLDEYPGNNLGLQLTIPITQAGNYAFGNFTYPLYGLNSIPKGTWCAKYRAMLSISWWQWHWNYNTSVTYYADIRVRSTNGTVVYQQDGVSPSTLTTGSGWGWFWNYPYQGYWTTLQGSNFTFNGYTIPSSGQYYLEVGFCATVTGYEGGTAYLMIDNSALAISNQTSLATTI
ncbi:MAG TPA: hypothetical protein VED00_03195, partial [archaeon]|nr:hypothetical protein [archaeon]